MEPTAVTRREHYLNANYGLTSWLLTTDHKRIALLYLISITFFFFIGGAAATLIRLELMTPQGNLRFTLEHLQNAQGQAQQVAPGDGHVLYLPLPAEVGLDYGLLMRDL